jgi:hypothetical protein
MQRSFSLARTLLGLGLLLAVCTILSAQAPTEGTTPKKKSFEGGKIVMPKEGDLKKYDDVITKEAKTSPGVFATHRIGDKLYFEIPTDAMGKLMLWSAEVAKGPSGVSWGGQSLGHRIVKFERRGNKVFLWNVAFEKRNSGSGKAIQRAVDSASMDTIMQSFSVEAEGKDRSVVIAATNLFVSEVADFSVKGAVSGGGSIDDSRSYLEEVKTFPTNIEVRALLTFRASSGLGALGLPAAPKGRATGGSGRSQTAVVHHSLVRLPDVPMMGRYFDPRVGYFTRSFEDYSSSKGWMEKKQFIARYRLEKKDPKAEVSEPVKPIVFYLGREVPEKWRSYLKKGVEDWQPAFEQAGFKNAIICKEAPSEREDPSWDAEDARHSVIRWVAEPTQNAMGPHIHDPRSGEIISSHIIFWHDIVKLAQLWYFVQCGASDPRVTKLPLNDEIIGDCLRYISAHEVGHTLGLRHNHRASQAYSIAQLRDPKFAEKHGTVASIMSYGRFNYVAQPEDKVKHLLPQLAPYDIFAIEWGYKPIAAKSPEEERTTLDTWAARQIKEPLLRFGGEDGPASVDPTVLTENIGDDAIEATAMGLKNLDRVLDKLVPATTSLGEDYALLREGYRAILQHRGLWFEAIVKQVGGVVEQRTLAGRGKESFVPVSRDRQKASVKFLLDNAFTTPKKLLNPDIVSRFKYVGVADDVLRQQKSLLTSLLASQRFRRLMDAEVIQGDQSYSAIAFLGDVQDGIWSELEQSQVNVDTIRRGLQRAYIEHFRDELKPKEAALASLLPRRGGDDEFADVVGGQSTDFRAVARAALENLSKKIAGAQARAKDPMTKVHLADCLREVKSLLTPDKPATSSTTAAADE